VDLKPGSESCRVFSFGGHGADERLADDLPHPRCLLWSTAHAADAFSNRRR
jgi:hypothetical protein